MPEVQFAVRSDGPSGGALKTRHYFEHALASDVARQVSLYMPEDTTWSDANPWYRHQSRATHLIDWESVKVCVISGWGWDRFIPTRFHTAPPFRVVHLIQSFDRVDPLDSQFRHLANPAVRICVSAPLEDALRAAGTSGPIHTIPACIESVEISSTRGLRDLDVLVVGYKRPDLACAIAKSLNTPDLTVQILTEVVGREAFIGMLAWARVVVCLPSVTEGFYLPALEAMAAGALVVCPDVRGNDYCRPSVNCLMPPYRVGALATAAREAASIPEVRLEAIRSGARATVAAHDIANERSKFRALLHEILGGDESG